MFMRDHHHMSGAQAATVLARVFRFTPDGAAQALHTAYADMTASPASGPVIGARRSGTCTFVTHRDTRAWQIKATRAAFAAGTQYDIAEVCNCRINRDRWGARRPSAPACPVCVKPEYAVQYCAGDTDVTSDVYAATDATEVRVWSPDATLIGAATRNSRGYWHVSGSDLGDWTRRAGRAHTDAQAAIMSVARDNVTYRAISAAFAA